MFRPVARLAAVTLVGAVTMALLPTAATPAQAAEEAFSLEMLPGGGQLLLRDTEEPFELATPTTVSGSVETETGVISNGSFSTPTVSGEIQITEPLAATVFIDAGFSEVTPGTASGFVNSDGTMVIEASMTVDLHIEVGDPPILTADCQTTPVNLTLASTSAYNPETDRVTLADSNLAVPEVPETETCGAIVADALNAQLAGGGHSVTMTLEGELTLPAETGEPSSTTLTVQPEGGSRLSDEVTMTAVVAPGEGSASDEVPTGVVDLRDGDTVLATEPLEEGVAEFRTSALAAGNHTLTARYRGDPVYGPSSSDAVSYPVAATPVVTSDLPEAVEIGAEPVDFDVTVTNTGLGATITNARVDVTLQRDSGTAAFTANRVSLERRDGDLWERVTLMEPPFGTTRPVWGSIGPATGFELSPGGEVSQRLRLAFPDDVGTPDPTSCGPANTTCPGPVRVTFEVVPVHPVDGTPDPVAQPAPSALAQANGVITLSEANRRASTIELGDPGIPPFIPPTPPVAPHTIRQGNVLQIWADVGPDLNGVEGFVEFYLDGQLVDASLSNGSHTPESYFPRLSASGLGQLYQLALPPNIATDTHQITVKYLGSDLLEPSQASTTFEVIPAAGPVYDCSVVGVPSHHFRASVIAQAIVPSSRVAGSEISLDNLDVRLLTDRGPTSTWLSNWPTGLVEVGTGGLDEVSFSVGANGGGTASATERTDSTVMPQDPVGPENPVDQTLAFHGETGSVTIEGAPGEAVPVTLDAITVMTTSAIGNLSITHTCVPLNAPATVGEVTVAGTTLSVTPAGPVEFGTEVTLTANTFPADAPGLVVFRDDDRDIGVVPVVDGQATMTTDELSPDTHQLTAQFFGGLTVPSTVSDPVELVVEEPPEQVSFTARYDDNVCGVFDVVADAAGLPGPEPIVQLGVEFLVQRAEQGEAVPFTPPPNEGPCEITVTFPESEVARLEAAADAWGFATTEDLVHEGGRFIATLIIILALSGQG